jgi:pimeloyl-ACP methyl ester carboxylesterase
LSGSTPADPDPKRIHADLAALEPPRKHYHWYYSTREADGNMPHAPMGVHAFLRAYMHYKSGDWPRNEPFPLKEWSAEELAKMPAYYIMPLHEGMAETVAPFMPSPAEIEACTWLPDQELAVYSSEFARTGFQGGLQWYRCKTSGINADNLQVFSNRTIDVRCCFIAGDRDCGVRQRPGLFEAMQRSACTNLVGCRLVKGAGHWVEQERPEEVTRLLLDFLR